MSDPAYNNDAVFAALAVIAFAQGLLVGPMIAWLFIRSRWRRHREREIAWFWDTRIPMLLASLQDADARRRWVEESRRTSQRIARDAIMEFLVGTAGSYRDRICLAYRELGLMDRDLVALRSPLRGRRIRALRRMTLVAAPSERAAVLGITDPTWVVHMLKTQVLARIGTAEDVQTALGQWQFTSRLHEHALKAVLDTMPQSEFVVLLARWEQFRASAIRRDLLAVGALRAPAVTEALLPKAAVDRDLEVRMGACQAAARLVADTSVPLLISLEGDPSWEVRAQVAKALGRFPDPKAVPTLGVLIADQAFWVRQNAASALARQGPAGHQFLIATAVRGHDRFARDTAAGELGRVGLAQGHKVRSP